MKKKSCIMCRKPQNNGIIVYGIRICKECEERLVKEDVDSDFYEYFKERIKKSGILSIIARGVEYNCQNYRL